MTYADGNLGTDLGKGKKIWLDICVNVLNLMCIFSVKKTLQYVKNLKSNIMWYLCEIKHVKLKDGMLHAKC